MSYKVGDIFYYDDDYINKANWCNENNKVIVEIEKDANGERQFQIQEIPASTEEQIANNLYFDLKDWFDTYYTQHEQKYRRLYTMKLKCDDGSDPYQKLMLLYQTAEKNRKRIQELESQYGIE